MLQILKCLRAMKPLLKQLKPSSNKECIIVRYAIGLATWLAGIADLLSAIVSRLNWNILLGAWPIVVHHGVQRLTVVVGFFLVILSYGLIRGKHQAWTITLALLILSCFLHILPGSLILVTLVALALTLLLAILNSYSRVRSDPPSATRGYIAFILGLGLGAFYPL